MRHEEIKEGMMRSPLLRQCSHLCTWCSIGLRPHHPKREYVTHALHDDAVLVLRARRITTITAEPVALDNGIMRDWPSGVPT